MRRRLLQAMLCLTMITAFAGCAASDTRRDFGQYMDDKWVSTKVKTDLAEDPITKASEIGVTTYKGVVQLNGFVSTKESIRRADEIAKEVKGVRAVQNDLVLR